MHACTSVNNNNNKKKKTKKKKKKKKKKRRRSRGGEERSIYSYLWHIKCRQEILDTSWIKPKCPFFYSSSSAI
jgi:hypothetical protein